MNLRGGLALLVVLTAGAVSQAQDEFKPITVTHVQGSVYLLDGAVDEIGASVGNDGVLLVDGGYMETFKGVRERTQEFGKGMPKFLINTHWHHAFANEAFAPTTILISQTNARERLKHENLMYIYRVPAQPAIAWPSISFENSLTIYFQWRRGFADSLAPRSHRWRHYCFLSPIQRGYDG